MNKNNLRFFGISILIITVLSMGFVNATTTLNLPADSGNYTTSFNFTCTTTLNRPTNATLWYNPSGGVVNTSLVTVTNFTGVTNQTTIYNGTVYLTALAGLRTYNFTCEMWALNDGVTLQSENSTDATSVTIDNTAPTTATPLYTNGTAKKNTTSLTLNISVSDATIGLNWSMCYVDINGTNQTFSVSSGWCNFTVGNLTGLTDGNQTISIYVNDSANNWRLNNTIVVQTDTTAPTAGASCSPSTVTQGSTTTCTCSSSDATSGVASSTASSTPSTAETGTYTYSCGVTDNAGNTASSLTSYYVQGVSSNGGGTTGTTASFWSAGTHAISDESFEEGTTAELQVRKRARVSVGGAAHYVGVVALTETKATINITSNPVQVILGIGEDAKVDVTDDGFYDIYVILNSITNNKADVTIQKIHEEIPAEEEGPVTTTGEVGGGDEGEGEDEGRNLTWLWILIAVVVLAIIIGGGIAAKKKQ